MTVTTHSYSAVVKRPDGRAGVLPVKGGSVTLDSTRSPHVQATLTVAVPAFWAPERPVPGGHWEETGEPQYDFFDGAPPFTISKPAERWIDDEISWVTDPLGDDPEVETPDPDIRDFFGAGAPPFYISPTERIIILPPRPAELRDIDPRNAPRVVITASRVDSFGLTQIRTFDLVLRDRRVGQGDGTIELALASDESLVDDYAPLVDDYAPLAMTNLEDVVQYVLEAALGPVDFEYPLPTPMPAAWTAQNMLPNPSARNNVDGWTTAAGAGAPTWTSALGANSEPGYVQVTHTAPVGNIVLSAADPWLISGTPGRRYVFLASLRTPHVMNLRIGVQFRNDAGAVLGTSAAEWLPGTTFWNLHTFVSAPAPAGTTRVTPIIGWKDSASGRVLHADCALLDEGEFIPGYFDGSDVDTMTYQYDWAEDADASPSTRTLLVDAPDPDSLTWRAGVGGIRFLAQLVQAAGYRLVCGEDRKWNLRAGDYQEADVISIAYAENMIDGTDTISRDADWFNAAVVRYQWTAQGVQRERVDSFALEDAGPTLVRTFDVNAPYPGPGAAEYFTRRAQGRGRDITATAVADWRARANTTSKVILNGALPQEGIVRTVTFDLEQDEMTITTRTIDTGSA